MKNQTIKTKYTAAIYGIAGDLFLAVLKFSAGIISHSNAVFSDSFHSLADVLSGVIIIIGISLSKKPPDKRHPEGYCKYEYVCGIIIAVFLLSAGTTLGIKSFKDLLSGNRNATDAFQVIPLIAEVISLILKFILYELTSYYAHKLNSDILLADAYHHRGDALASACALIGVIAQSTRFHRIDTIAGIVVCIFIVSSAVEILKNSLKQFIQDKSSDEYKPREQ